MAESIPRSALSGIQAATVVARGFLMGAADVVPGVSGGTMAFILGIYRRLLEAIRAFDLRLARLLLGGEVKKAAHHVDALFLAWLGAGIFAALMFFTRVVPLPKLIVSDPVPVYGLFFGLVAASVGTLLAQVERLRAGDFVWIACGCVAALAIVNLVPVDTPEAPWFVALSGAVAICAMILPGISGSFILLLLRKYAYVFDAIGRLDLAVLIPFAFGAAVGLMSFSRALTWLLRRHFRRTMLAITGVLVGSLWAIWPFQDRVYETVRGKARLISTRPVWPQAMDADVLVAVAMAITGAAAVWAVQRLAERHVA